ncbi:isoleucyl-tRNA synthetase, mitochondrial isoform X2 [Oratosquilla oratoria]|uniref:isoleucyl-tRNA synthetase, mitochondrial isoform X2 n=1 Tax=Oratosquilla oratoria TaxID=337810 RepID=UPI003F75F9EF
MSPQKWILQLTSSTTLNIKQILYRRFSEKVITGSSKDRSVGKYKNTVILPSTTFPLKVEGVKRVNNEKKIQEDLGFLSLYEWQQKQNRAEEFVLHDGPPYANGKPHIGHAVNRILKDITNRQKVLRGFSVNYRPGWDCHGLPIELKALKKEKKRKKKQGSNSLSPLDIRAKARQFALEAIEIQRTVFKRWGIMADWNSSYYTFETEYVMKQLTLFAQLYDEDFVFQAYKPVYFSPSSGTALAEAELEYNLEHKSPSLYLALPIVNVPVNLKAYLQNHQDLNAYLVIWTTTPWTLPANKAICYAPNITYVLVETHVHGEHLALIVAEELLHELENILGTSLSKIASFNSTELSSVRYRHPVKEVSCPCIQASHVTLTKGTGLVHTAPAHGHDDFKVALEHKLPVECDVNEKGCYTEEAGLDLAGKSVLKEGNDLVLDIIGKYSGPGRPPVVLSCKEFTHSYPYDWRTKKPVIIRASKQWFIDTDKLKEKSLEVLSSVQILPQSLQMGMKGMLERRPYWCISRQRVWGVPIPVFYDKETGEPFTSRRIVEHLNEIFKKEGVDSWWKLDEEKLLPPELVEDHQKKKKPLPLKGSDILDIWFDSGSSWHCVLEGKPADLYLEGVDQFNGWFQSSLLTSVASTGRSPYRKLYVHGFTLDEQGQKMSKSLGNVVDPEIVTDGGKNLKKNPAYGADVLRWWVAGHVTNNTNLSVGPKILQQSNDQVQKVRSVIWFLLSMLHGYKPDEHSLPVSDLRLVDQYMLHILYEHILQIQSHYEDFRYHRVILATNNFVAAQVSAFYFSLVKDRLYCDETKSSKRISAQTVLYYLLDHLLLSLGPVVPHLVEEAALHHPLKKDLVFHQTCKNPELSWHHPSLCSIFDLCFKVRDSLNQKCSSTNLRTLDVKLTATGEMYDALKKLQTSSSSCESGLCEFLQVCEVTLVHNDDSLFIIETSPAKGARCERCRKHTAPQDSDLCVRCQNAIGSLQTVHH